MGYLTGRRAAYTEAALTLQWECRLRSQPRWLSLSAHLAVSVRAPSSPTVRYLIILYYTQHVPILPSPLPVRYLINIINYMINIHRYSRYLICRASYREGWLRTGARMPPGALPTLLMDWSEAICYTHAELIGGVRACPFFFEECI